MGKVVSVDRNLMRSMNQSTLLNLIRTHAPISRTQLVQLSGLSTGTVVSIATDLLKQELIMEQGVANSNLGRKAGLLRVHPNGAYVLGLSLVENDEIVIVLLNLLGEIVQNSCWQVQLHDSTVNVVQVITKKVETFLQDCQVPREKILGLGCGFPGNVNSQTGSSVDNWIHNWHDLSITDPLSQALRMPVYLDNVVNCLGSYEKLYGHGRPYRDFLVITLGRGVGMAMILNDDLYRGSRGWGGEFGHIPCVPDGRRCECGNQGCLEAYVADHGILASYHELRQKYPDDARLAADLSLDEIRTAAHEGNERLRSLLTQAGQYLGTALASMVNIFNPECVILTGAHVHPDDVLFASMRETMHRYIFSRLDDNLPLVITPVTSTRWAQGAGTLVLRHFFLSPAQAGS